MEGGLWLWRVWLVQVGVAKSKFHGGLRAAWASILKHPAGRDGAYCVITSATQYSKVCSMAPSYPYPDFVYLHSTVVRGWSLGLQ